jgi:hypothetical protein
MGIGTGCFYIAPVQRPEVNVPPEITSESPPEGEVLLTLDPFPFSVRAFDPDATEDDHLTFDWNGIPLDLGVEPISTVADDDTDDDIVIWASTIYVPRDPRISSISCTVIDGEDLARVDWTVIVETE